MLGRLGKEYVSLNVPGDPFDPNRSKEGPRKSLWRRWNQLSRFQRSLLYMLLLGIILAIIYFRPSQKQPPLPQADSVKGEDDVENELPAVLHSAAPSPSPSKPSDTEKDLPKVDGSKDLPAQAEEPIIQKKNSKEQVEENNDVEQIRSPPQEGVKFPGPSNERQSAVIAAFKHAWKGYKKFAWGHDHLRPITGGFHDWFSLGLTIVDSLDTMYIMGMKEEFTEAREWVANNLHFDVNKDVNLFEVTIRVLGGLLSAYHLSGDKMFLDKAVDLGNRLLPSFSSESGVPYSDINLMTRKAHAPKWSPDSSTSEVTTIQLEFRDLSRSTGDPRFEEAASKVSLHIHNLPKTNGLVPIFINAYTGQFRSYATITMGARGDSYYEYLLKQWIQTGRTLDYLRDDYLEAIEGAMKHLTKRTPQNKYLFVGELLAGGRDFKPKMDHLTCYLPGTLALGVHYGLTQEHMKFAEDLLNTCFQTYAQQPTFLAPEITYFNIQDAATNDIYVKANDAHNLLRPEFLESLWYMYQFTGNKTYQDWGWQIFQGNTKAFRLWLLSTKHNVFSLVLRPQERDRRTSVGP
ncbi:endoplasmic reticulum mannosyl-oligosaccharide 1,2-alpha-mannosidase isoform X2 [Anabrus simplex]|uniref:endoplasmic reticulum mannosyl-oligosaccharide 1,2-alpha-mannosidase isoform X2 n=1 Tax=Anabrus simplex TaxID=316456 RepID=UPI0034DD4510